MKLKFPNSFFVLLLLTAIIMIKPVYAQNYTLSKEFRNANTHWFMKGYPSDRMFDMRTKPPAPTLLPPNTGFWFWTGESGSGISDTATGDLLFYSDGSNVYNRNHQIMPNGMDLLRNSNSSSWWNNFPSSYQQLCIIPVIDTPNKFHVFSVMSWENPGGLYYWVVDMNLDNGLGDVEVGRRDSHLYKGPLMESITAVPGNNCDVWVLAHPVRDSTFLAYHITAAGLNKVPVVSAAGPASLNKRNTAFERGGITVSPQRDRIAIASYDVINEKSGKSGWTATMIAQFDPETGKISEGIVLDTLLISNTVIFSTDGNMLYVGGEQMDTLMQRHDECLLLQYDVSKKTAIEMRASRNRLSELKFGAQSSILMTFRRLGDTIMLSDFSYIPEPNKYGALCGYNNTTNYFAPEENVYWGRNWGNDAVYPIYHRVTSTKDTSLCKGSQINLSGPGNYRSYSWNDGSTNPEISVSQAGTYWVSYETSCNRGVDTFHVQFSVLPVPDITVDERNLSMLEAYDSYQWLLDGVIIPGATAKIHTAIVNGDYQVIVSRGGCTVTSDKYKVTNASNIEEWANKQKIRMHPNPASTVIHIESAVPVYVSIIGLEGKVYKKGYNIKQVDIHDLAEGLYLIQVKNADGLLLKTERFTKISIP